MKRTSKKNDSNSPVVIRKNGYDIIEYPKDPTRPKHRVSKQTRYAVGAVAGSAALLAAGFLTKNRTLIGVGSGACVASGIALATFDIQDVIATRRRRRLWDNPMRIKTMRWIVRPHKAAA